MGLVFRAQHLILDQPIALKLVRSDVASRPGVVARFLDEARAIARLKSPHVVHVFDSGTAEDGTPYMALELLHGWDLHTVVEQDGPLPFDLAARYVMQACHAVAEAHSLGIIHRDLKPENLFLHHGEDGLEIIKVLDFGVSKHLRRSDGRSHTIQGETVGSPHYMAPEQMAAKDVDERSDIWSLGVVLFELVTGRFPFEGNSFAEVYGALLAGDAEPLSCFHSAVPPGFEAIVERCLRKNPAERYRSVTELAEALSGFSRTPAHSVFHHEDDSERPTMISVAPRAEIESSWQTEPEAQAGGRWGWVALSLMAVLAVGAAGASALGFGAGQLGAGSVSEQAAAVAPAAAARDPFFVPVQVAAPPRATVALVPAASGGSAPSIEAGRAAASAAKKPWPASNAKSKGSPSNEPKAAVPPRAANAAFDDLIAPYGDLPELRAQRYDSKR
jgi:serine/threonine-protein kinase